ncbi:glycosyltransferase family 4 protein [Trinickia dinghuensis]|uniref:Glycosyltransferase n=1 Tax=Trinickia dinghuensis TaxID=2291023 RepID=A0A3D8K2D0_9BURK|nr:glycosyltransferase family 4 protein [Trinickia dinghuensis]RDU99593.1 glycosyltransferase [Trinickia dinghuensis]
MRIQFVIGNLSDYHVPRYRALVELAVRRGFQVSLVELYEGTGFYDYPQSARRAFMDGAPSEAVTVFKDAVDGRKHWMLVCSRLGAIVRATRPDFVITLGYHTSYSIYLCILRTLLRRFRLVYMSDSKADDGRRHRIKEALKRIFVSRFDGALVAGEKHRRYAKSLGIPMQRSRVGFDVIDVAFFRDAAKRARAHAEYSRYRFALPPRYVLCVSRFVERKNVPLVIEAYARAGLADTGVSLMLIGAGPLEHAIREKIDALGLDGRVLIFTEIVNADMPVFYALSDFVVLASAFDQWGLCVNEAMASGRPAIVSDTCGCANELVLDGINGYVVRPGDVDQLARSMRRLNDDDALRTRFAANAESTISGWTPQLFAENVLALATAVGATR